MDLHVEIEKVIDILLKSNVKLAKEIAKCQNFINAVGGLPDYSIENAKQEYEAVSLAVQILREKMECQRQFPEWISVNDRLPEPKKRVLGVMKVGIVGEVYITQSGEWHRPGTSIFWEEPITHWMPLPDPPVAK